MNGSYTVAMPIINGHAYDIRPRRPGWSWSAFDLDEITPIGRGVADTKAEAEAAVTACVARHQNGAEHGET